MLEKSDEDADGNRLDSNCNNYDADRAVGDSDFCITDCGRSDGDADFAVGDSVFSVYDVTISDDERNNYCYEADGGDDDNYSTD